MIEYPEGTALAMQLENHIVGRKIASVLPPSKAHKFCWYNGDPAEYNTALSGSTVTGAEAFGIFVTLHFSNGQQLCINDGVNVRLLPATVVPNAYQLLMVFDDGDMLCFTVAMYGGIVLHDGSYDNVYYLKSRAFIDPLSAAFPAYYQQVFENSKPTLSAKALLAAEQRFPGIGNGTVQDILFTAHIHPKRKIGTLTQAEREELLHSVVGVLRDMTQRGGRDTEKDLFGNPGGYRTLLSKNTLAAGCPCCGGVLTKEAYMGGSVYYCAVCQPL